MKRRSLLKSIAGLLALPLVGRSMASSASTTTISTLVTANALTPNECRALLANPATKSASAGLRCCVVNWWNQTSDYEWRGRLIGCKAGAGLKLEDAVYIENGIAYPCTKENPLSCGIVVGIECES